MEVVEEENKEENKEEKKEGEAEEEEEEEEEEGIAFSDWSVHMTTDECPISLNAVMNQAHLIGMPFTLFLSLLHSLTP